MSRRIFNMYATKTYGDKLYDMRPLVPPIKDDKSVKLKIANMIVSDITKHMDDLSNDMILSILEYLIKGGE